MEKEIRLRTDHQHRALFKYLGDLANELNQAGVDQRMFIEHLNGWEIPITKEFLHHIWKMKQERMFLTDSTKKLTTDQVSQVYDVVNKFVSQEFGIECAFPSEEVINSMNL
jgi:hypothetical protein